MNKNIKKLKVAACTDENQNASTVLKKTGKTNTNNNEITRRVLGNLENLTNARFAKFNDKGATTEKEVHRSKFEKIKPKVDTHWNKKNEASKKGEASVTAVTSKSSKVIQEIIDQIINASITTVISQDKVLKKSNPGSVKSDKATFNVQRNGFKGKNNRQKAKIRTVKKVTEKNLPKPKTSGLTANVAATASKANTNKLDTKENTTFNNNENSHCKNGSTYEKNIATTGDIEEAGLQLSIGAKIRDIDEGFDNYTTSVKEYANEIYSYLFDMEAKKPIQINHMKNHLEINGKMRAILIDWVSEMAHQFHLLMETFQLSVAIIDHYLDVVKDTKRTELQLVGTTALFLATKYEELCSPLTCEFAYITDNAYTTKEICQMEIKILKTLKYDLSWPLSIQFLRRFSKAADAENSHHNMAKYFIELTTIEADMAHYKPSEIAAASLFLSLNLLKNDTLTTGFNDTYWTPTLQYYARYSANHLKPISRKIANIARNAPNVPLKAVYTKYQSTKFEKVSTRSELYGPLMDSIINSSDGNKIMDVAANLKQN